MQRRRCERETHSLVLPVEQIAVLQVIFGGHVLTICDIVTVKHFLLIPFFLDVQHRSVVGLVFLPRPVEQ